MFWQCYGDYSGQRNIKRFGRYVMAKLEEWNYDYAYRLYVTESLRLQGEQKYIGTSFEEILHPPKEIDGAQIVADIMKRAGLKAR